MSDTPTAEKQDHLLEFSNLIGLPRDLNTLDDYEKLREQLTAWRKQQTAAIWERYEKAETALLHAAWERGIYERRDDGVFVPSGEEGDRTYITAQGREVPIAVWMQSDGSLELRAGTVRPPWEDEDE